MAASFTQSLVNMTGNVSGFFQPELDKKSGDSITIDSKPFALAQWPLIATAVALCLSAYVVKSVFSSKDTANSKHPFVGTGSLADRYKQFDAGGGWDHYVEGYQQFKNTIWRIATGPNEERLVLPVRFLPELNKLPDTVLNVNNVLQERLQSKHTLSTNTHSTGEGDSPLLVVSRTTLTSALPRFVNVMSKGVFEDLDRDFPSSNDWTEVKMYHTITRLVSRTTSRVFVGNDFCQDDKYIDMAAHYSVLLYQASAATSALPAFLRPLLAPYLPQVKNMLNATHEAMDTLRPPVKQRLREMTEQGENFEKPDDVMQAVINTIKVKEEHGRDGEDQVTMAQMAAHVAAIDSPTMTVTDSIYTLAANPDILSMIREDIQQAIDQNGGELNNVSIPKMLKLDSFLKEIMRLYALKASTFERKVLRTFTLSDGTVIPEGSHIEVPWAAVREDASVYPNPFEFDALRFYNLSQAEGGDKAEHKFTGVTTTCLTWGYGKHACPGRHFVVNELKVLVAALVLNYDFRMPDGIEGRYENMRLKSHQVPNTKKIIMVKKL